MDRGHCLASTPWNSARSFFFSSHPCPTIPPTAISGSIKRRRADGQPRLGLELFLCQGQSSINGDAGDAWVPPVELGAISL